MEATSLDHVRGAMLSLGAVDLNDPKRTYYQEYRIWPGALVHDDALVVAGFTPEQIVDKNKPTFAEAAEEFIAWVDQSACTIIAGHNVMYDLMFLKEEMRRAKKEWKWGFRSVDLHAVAFCKVWAETKKQPLKEDGRSALSLDGVSGVAGITFRRGTAHNALEDAKLTAECFSRLLFKKKLFKEFD